MSTKKVEEIETKKSIDNVQIMMELSQRVSRSTIAVIDTIVQRGGFKGEELSTIGQLRDQSLQLVQIIEQIQSEAAQG